MKKIYLGSINSTNSWAKEHIKELEDKSVIYSFNQTSGRGRLNRSWCNLGEENLFLSIFLKPSDSFLDIYNNLTQYLSLVLVRVFEDYGIKAQIKWPNDLKINNKKIAGILAELATGEKGEFLGIILGVGVNLNADLTALNQVNQAATALNIELGQKIAPLDFLNKVLDKFTLAYDNFLRLGFNSIKDAYKKSLNCLGKSIRFNFFEQIIQGTALDINDEGALIIIDDKGETQIFSIGEIL